MSLLTQIGGMLAHTVVANLNKNHPTRQQAPGPQQSHQQSLGELVGPALRQFVQGDTGQRLIRSFSQMAPGQRGNLLGSLLQTLSHGGTNVGNLLSRLGIRPEVASQPHTATPQEFSKVAAHVNAQHPGVLQRAKSFYAEHPTLVKVVGTVAVAHLVSRLSRRR